MAQRPSLALAQPAHVSIDILPNGFVDVINTPNESGDPRLCKATVKLVAPAPTGISQAAPNSTIVVQGGPMRIDFDLKAASQCRLAGVAFKRIRGSGPANGHRNIPKDKITIEEKPNGDSTIHVSNEWKDHGAPGTWSWALYLIVQDVSGDLGIIDPDIENQD